jgi:DNA polymerase-3 subunit gamma/tau
MAGTVLYRKWRPQHFADIVGQDPIVRTLRNAVAQDKIAHAYLFAGPRGTGKTTAGRILAKAINATQTDDGDLVDDAAAQDFETSLDLIEIDAASNRGIDDIRDLRDRAQYAPSASRYKVYLIDEVHQLTGPAADALLKTLEEPPPHVIFILATTDPEQLKSTVRSRCQRFDFRRISVEALVGRLRYIADHEKIEIPDAALNLIAREATGSARDAVNLLDQVWATYGDQISLDEAVEALGLSIDKRALDVARAALTKDLPAGLACFAAVQDDAVDLNRFKRQIVQHLRHALLVQTGSADGLALSQPEREAIDELVKGTEVGVTVAALKAFNDADVRGDPYQSLPLELALARLVYEKELQPQPAPAPARGRGAQPGRQGGQGRQQRGQQQRRSQQQGAQEQGQQPRRSQPPPARREAAASGQGRPEPPGAPRAASDRSPRKESRPAPAPVNRSPQEQLVALLNGSCVIPELEGDEITLAFLPAYVDFHLGMVRESAAAVAQSASTVLGRTVTIQCTEAEDSGPKRSSLAEEAEKLGAKRVSPPAG